MSIEKAIHERWEGYHPLTRLLPVERLRTGWQAPTMESELALTMPYCSLHRDGEEEVLTPSGGAVIRHVLMRFTIYSDDLDEAKKIASAVHDRYDSEDFSYSEGTVLLMRRTGGGETRLDDGTWQVDIVYATMTEE